MRRVALHRAAALVLAAAPILAPPLLPAQEDSTAVSDPVRREAAGLLQDLSTTPFLDSLEVERTARALLAIRAAIPQVRDISNYRDRTLMEVSLWFDDESSVRPDTLSVPAGTTIRPGHLESVGLRALDSLNRVAGADSLEVLWIRDFRLTLYPHFSRYPNVSVLAQAYQRLPSVDRAGEVVYLGGGDHILHFRKEGLWYFVFSRGTGDCPSGCIHRDYYYVTHDPGTGASELVDSLPDDRRRAPVVHLWDIPTRRSVGPYRDFEDLRAQARDDRWWIRHHAVSVLAFLVREPDRPWLGDRSQDPGHVQRMRRAVEEHPSEVLFLLVERVADEDEWVRGWARRALVHLAGVDHGEGEEAQRLWQAWAEQQVGG